MASFFKHFWEGRPKAGTSPESQRREGDPRVSEFFERSRKDARQFTEFAAPGIRDDVKAEILKRIDALDARKCSQTLLVVGALDGTPEQIKASVKKWFIDALEVQLDEMIHTFPNHTENMPQDIKQEKFFDFVRFMQALRQSFASPEENK
jgi:hypothetical protein